MQDDRKALIAAIQAAARDCGEPLSRRQFLSHSGMTEYRVLKHFESWTAALDAAGVQADRSNVKREDRELLEDWGKMVRENREIPTRSFYRRNGRFGVNTFCRFGPWSSIPEAFREFASDRPEWADVIPLLPCARRSDTVSPRGAALPLPTADKQASASSGAPSHAKLVDRPTYGNPIDFRGLRHEPTNENGVIFLFGMVAKELGYYVEGVQAGFPDCEAKRQVGRRKWQRVRIEFEFESRSFRDHGHPASGCDMIVCWLHNWPDCPLEVLELRQVIEQLPRGDD